jgi:hypothetical protein
VRIWSCCCRRAGVKSTPSGVSFLAAGTGNIPADDKSRLSPGLVRSLPGAQARHAVLPGQESRRPRLRPRRGQGGRLRHRALPGPPHPRGQTAPSHLLVPLLRRSPADLQARVGGRAGRGLLRRVARLWGHAAVQARGGSHGARREEPGSAPVSPAAAAAGSTSAAGAPEDRRGSAAASLAGADQQHSAGRSCDSRPSEQPLVRGRHRRHPGETAARAGDRELPEEGRRHLGEAPSDPDHALRHPSLPGSGRPGNPLPDRRGGGRKPLHALAQQPGGAPRPQPDLRARGQRAPAPPLRHRAFPGALRPRIRGDRAARLGRWHTLGALAGGAGGRGRRLLRDLLPASRRGASRGQ